MFKHIPSDIILIIRVIAGFDMSLEEWKKLFRKAWENDYEYLQIDRFVKIREGRYTIRNCEKITFTECIPETNPFW